MNCLSEYIHRTHKWMEHLLPSFLQYINLNTYYFPISRLISSWSQQLLPDISVHLFYSPNLTAYPYHLFLSYLYNSNSRTQFCSAFRELSFLLGIKCRRALSCGQFEVSVWVQNDGGRSPVDNLNSPWVQNAGGRSPVENKQKRPYPSPERYSPPITIL